LPQSRGASAGWQFDAAYVLFAHLPRHLRQRPGCGSFMAVCLILAGYAVVVVLVAAWRFRRRLV
jgi:hypothetical protein